MKLRRWLTTSVPPARTRAYSGFTLIELLASITILMVMISVIGIVFTESDRAWRQGTARAEIMTEGRAAINLIAEELQYAIADDVLTFFIAGPDSDYPYGAPVTTFGFDNDEIYFVALSSQTEGRTQPRATREIYYYLKERTRVGTTSSSQVIPHRYELFRTAHRSENLDRTASNRVTHCYANTDWYTVGRNNPHQNRAPVAENVVSLAFYTPSGQTNEMERGYDSQANSNALPLYVDILMEVMGEDDAEKLALLAERNAAQQRIDEFIEQRSQRFSTRVFFQNRIGYKPRVDI